MNSWRIMWSLFSRKDRLILGVLVLLMVFGGLLEVLGIGLLFPYVTILQDPSKIFESRYLGAIYRLFSFNSYQSFSIAMSGGLLTIFCLKGLFTLWFSNIQLRFIYGKQSQLGRSLLAQYLNQPYAFFLSANTSTLIGNLTSSVNQVCSGVIQAILSLIAELIVLIGLIAFLVLLSPFVTFVGLFFVGGLSLIFVRVVKSRVARYGSDSDIRWKAMIRTVNEAISSAKEVQVLGRAQFFVDQFDQESREFLWAFGRNSILSQLPKVTLETGAVAGMVLVSVIAILHGSSEKGLFALLAVFALATLRLVPSANRILQSWNVINFNRPAIDVIASSVANLSNSVVVLPKHDDGEMNESKLRYCRTLKISVRSFDYPTNPFFRLQNINIDIPKGRTVAFIGHSGSGKTTLIDLVLGLFPDFDGNILVDGNDIRGNIAAWRRCIGYIPQSFYLRDDTIARNVAFGIPDQDIDTEKLAIAVSLAGLEPVIRSQPAGLETVVGDRGVRLSGGERQRIGIARALYNDPDLLVFDEATSALDNETERQIVDSILGLSPNKTIIVIAHRLSTVTHCDDVYLMNGGRIIDHGSFDEVTIRNPGFVNPQGSTSAARV